MRVPSICLIMLGCLLPWCAGAGAADPMLSHDVYFTLNDDADDAKEKLLAGCKKYLAGHPGVVWFAAGILAEDFDRDVNDRQFHVALHMVFKDKASHDRYQDSDRHHKFIEEFKEGWKAVRVFDSSLNMFLHADTVQKKKDQPDKSKKDQPDLPKKGQPDLPSKPQLPDPAASFAGMISGKVVTKYDSGEFVLGVEKVVKQWRKSKAADANSLVGKTVLVGPRKDGGEPIAKFIRSLEVGEVITIDVAHTGKGEALTIIELTERQRERVK